MQIVEKELLERIDISLRKKSGDFWELVIVLDYDAPKEDIEKMYENTMSMVSEVMGKDVTEIMDERLSISLEDGNVVMRFIDHKDRVVSHAMLVMMEISSIGDDSLADFFKFGLLGKSVMNSFVEPEEVPDDNKNENLSYFR